MQKKNEPGNKNAVEYRFVFIKLSETKRGVVFRQ